VGKRALWRPDQCSLRQRNPNILRLPAINCIRGHRVSKELALGASARLPADTVVAFLAGRVERHNNLLPQLEFRHGITLLYYGTDKLVSSDKIARALQVAAVKV
jgi:hypothetical protein